MVWSLPNLHVANSPPSDILKLLLTKIYISPLPLWTQSGSPLGVAPSWLEHGCYALWSCTVSDMESFFFLAWRISLFPLFPFCLSASCILKVRPWFAFLSHWLPATLFINQIQVGAVSPCQVQTWDSHAHSLGSQINII